MKNDILLKIARAELTAFQKAVYRATAAIPRGQTRTYAQIAARIGSPHAVRAVGNALHRNPFAPAVPCHRVVRSDGTLGGFALGAATKKRLLRREGALTGRR